MQGDRTRLYVPGVRRGIDRLIATLARVVVLGYFRSVQVWGRSRVPVEGPVLLVANHFNGFVDPVIVTSTLGRLPRFLAKSTLWKIVALRPVLAFAGAVPVYRQVDGATSGNQRSFERVESELRDGATVAIFPEGTTHDQPRLAEVHTGAARIALGARARGATGLTIVPVGIAYDDKLALRSRAFVRVGEPIDLDVAVPDLTVDDTDREAVRMLTEQVADRLQTVSPEFEDRFEHGALSLAAELTLRERGAERGRSVSFAERESVASRLGRRPAADRRRLVEAVAAYNLELSLLGVRDDVLMAGFHPTQLLRRLVIGAVLGFVLITFAVVGILANAVPVVLVALAGRSVKAPVTKGTVRVLVGLIAFPVSWAVTAWLTVDGWWQGLLAMVLFAVTGLVAVRFVEVAIQIGRDLEGWRLLQNRQGLLTEARDQRAATVAIIQGELEAPPTARLWPDGTPAAAPAEPRPTPPTTAP
jgi:glycerol-3-phosphate O-acyltransferase / dihydroxyacetone phosphate acyltransferase